MIILLIPVVISPDNSLFAPPKFCLTKNNGYTFFLGGGDVGGKCVDTVKR